MATRKDLQSAQSPAHGAPSAEEQPSPLVLICNRHVQLFKQAFGRGPAKARAHYAGSDTLLVVLERTLTASEQSLQRYGEQARLRELRLVLQGALEQPARAIVEDVLGRPTLAFVTGIDPQRDLAVNVFTLGESETSLSERRQTSIASVTSTVSASAVARAAGPGAPQP
jgi:uncharacterized protein YbcI